MRFGFLALTLLCASFALPSRAETAPVGTTTDQQLAKYLEQIKTLAITAPDSKRLTYITLQMNGGALLNKFNKNRIEQSAFDKATQNLGKILADNNVTDAEAKAWIDEVTPLNR